MELVEFAPIRSDEPDPIARLVRPVCPGVQPSDAFVYWTRRMLLNVMQSASVPAIEAERRAS